MLIGSIIQRQRKQTFLLSKLLSKSKRASALRIFSRQKQEPSGFIGAENLSQKSRLEIISQFIAAPL